MWSFTPETGWHERKNCGGWGGGDGWPNKFGVKCVAFSQMTPTPGPQGVFGTFLEY